MFWYGNNTIAYRINVEFSSWQHGLYGSHPMPKNAVLYTKRGGYVAIKENFMKMQSIQDLMTTGLTYVLDFEEKIAQAAPKMAEASTNPDLKDAFQKTESKSQEYAQKVEQTFKKLGKSVERNDNNIAKAMLAEVENMISNTDAGPVRDAALIVAANQQQMYRVASYGSLAHYAELLGKQDAAKDLNESLKDSKNGDEKFTQIGEQKVNQEAIAA